MFGWRGLLGLVFVLLISVGGLVLYFWLNATEAELPTPTLVLASPVTVPDFSVVLIQESVNSRRVQTCERNRCIPQLLPAGDSQAAVFDGQGWLFYQEAESALTNLTKKILMRTELADKKTTQLLEQTPLTSPRDLLISPTGKHTAFFLDNIDRPEAELTELWVYDREKNGVRLLAEKLYRPDIRSHVRWNRAGNMLWFLADTGAQDNPEDVIELVIVPLNDTVATRFSPVDWQELQDEVDTGVMDIAPSGKKAAYVTTSFFGRKEINVVAEGRSPQRLSAKGEVVYLQFLEDDSLLYGVQDSRGVTFWKWQEAVTRHIARQSGQLLSAQGEPTGEFIMMALAQEKSIVLQLLHTSTGTVTPHASVAATTQRFVLTQLAIQAPLGSTSTESAAREFDDAELAAFIDQNFPSIVGAPGAKAKKLIISDQANSVYVDYDTAAGAAVRVLLVVHDVGHADWSIKGRYEAAQAEWHKVQGGGLPDPKPVRIYEWEESVGQWILKLEVRS